VGSSGQRQKQNKNELKKSLQQTLLL